MNTLNYKGNLRTKSSILDIIDCFQAIIENNEFENLHLFFESTIMLDNESNYFLVSLYANYIYESKTIETRINLSYELAPTLFMLKNLFSSDDKNEFFLKIKNINVVKHIMNENLIPFDIQVIEINL